MSVTGEPDGNPVKCGIPIGDLSAGLFCAVGDPVGAARARAHGPRAVRRHVAVRGRAGALDLGDGRAVGDRAGAGQARLRAPADARRTRRCARADGYITVGGNTQPLFERLCAAIGRPELVDDPRFADNDDRMANVAELVAELEARARRARHRRVGRRRWSRAASRAGRSTTTPRCSPTRTPRRARWRSRSSTRSRGTIRALGIPVKLSDTPGRDPPPGAAARPAHGGDPARGRLRASEIEALRERRSSWSAAARRRGSRSTAPRRTTR